MMDEKLLYNKKEVAQVLNLSIRTVDALISRKELKVRRIGRRVLVPRDVVLRFAGMHQLAKGN